MVVRACAVAIVLVALAAYGNSFEGQFLLDDEPTILENPDIGKLWPPSYPLTGPPGLPSEGRPLVSLSLSVNHALGGDDPFGYHAFNLAVHVLAALLLFGVARRTLRRVPAFERDAVWLAAAGAVLWVAHPITTGAVTYVSQRAESMMSLFFLGAFYAVERLAREPARRRWAVLAVVSCYLSVLCKEVAYAIPLLLALYDRAFLSGSWRETVRARGRLYLLMALSWLFLLAMQGEDPRSGTVLWQYRDFNPYTYLLTSAKAIATYAGLLFWPHPLVLDYGWPIVRTLGEGWPWAVALAALLGLTCVAVVRRPRLGFPAAWCFLILAPTSSFVPIVTEIMAEHRFYLPSAMLVPVVVLAVWRAGAVLGVPRRAATVLGAVALAVAAGTLVTLTRAQNERYHDVLAMWSYNARHTPDNRRVLFNHALELMRRQRHREAQPLLERAAEVDPHFADTFRQLSYVQFYLGDTRRALDSIERALRLAPEDPAYLSAKGAYLALLGDPAAGLRLVEDVLRRDPGHPDARRWRVNILLILGELGSARRGAAELLGRSSDDPEIDRYLARTARAMGRSDLAERLEDGSAPR